MSAIEVRDRRDAGWFYLDNEVIDDYAAKMKPLALACYVYLCRRANADQKAWPSQRTMAEDLGVDRGTVRSAVKQLVALKLIHLEIRRNDDGSHKSTIYTLLKVPKHGSRGGSIAHRGPIAKGGPNGPEEDTEKEDTIESNPPTVPPKGGRRSRSLQGKDAIDHAAAYDEFIEEDPLGPKMARLIKLAASENKSKRMRFSRAVSEFIEPIRMLRDDGLTDDALRFGIYAALKAQAPNMSYVKKAAGNYQPEAEPDEEQEPETREERAKRRTEGYEWLFGEAKPA